MFKKQTTQTSKHFHQRNNDGVVTTGGSSVAIAVTLLLAIIAATVVEIETHQQIINVDDGEIVVDPLTTMQLHSLRLTEQIEHLLSLPVRTHESEQLLHDLQQRQNKFQAQIAELTKQQHGHHAQQHHQQHHHQSQPQQQQQAAPTIDVSRDFEKLQRKLDELKLQIEAMNVRFEAQIAKEKAQQQQQQQQHQYYYPYPQQLQQQQQQAPTKNEPRRPSLIKRFMSFIRPGGGNSGTMATSNSGSSVTNGTWPDESKATILNAQDLLTQLTRQRVYLDNFIKRLEIVSAANAHDSKGRQGRRRRR